MALAHLAYEGPAGEAHRFRIDLGGNAFYAWAVGGDPTRSDGVTVLGRRGFESELIGPLSPPQRRNAVLDVPMGIFSRENPSVQILSFRTQTLDGPAASDIVSVDGDVRPSPLRLAHPPRLAAEEMSASGVLDTIVNLVSGFLPVLTSALPAINPLLTGLLGTGQAGNRVPADAAVVGSSSGNPDTMRLLTEVVQQLNRLLPPPSGAAPTPPPPGFAAPAPAAPPARAQALGYSEATAIPAALIAALPALMPLLQQVLSPQTIQGVLQTADPNRLISTVTQGLAQLAGLGLQANQQQLDHLRALNPGLGDDLAAQLLMAASLSTVSQRGLPEYTRTERVQLRLPEVELTSVAGRPDVLFAAGQDWHFPVEVQTPRPIRKGHLHLAVKRSPSLDVLYECGYDVEVSMAGRLDTVPVVPAGTVSQLESGSEVLVVLTLTWPTKRGRLGASVTQVVVVAGPVTLGPVTGDGELIPLNDLDAHRPFWHRTWAATLDDTMRRADLNVTYTYRLDVEGADIVRDATRVEASVPEGRRELTGSISTGLRCGLVALNQLLHSLTGASLQPPELEALRSPALARHLGGRATTRVQLHGTRGDSVAIWVWPEVKVHRIVLHRTDEVAPTGQVKSFTDTDVRFPFPVLAHVVGAVT